MKKIRFYIFFYFLCFSWVTLHAQKDTPQQLYEAKKYTETIIKSTEKISEILENISISDSLSIAKLYFYKGASQYYLERYTASIQSYTKGINFCPVTDSGMNFKGELYYERAFSEYELKDYVNSYQSSKKAALYMSSAKHPNYDYLISIYCDLAEQTAYLGFYKDAKQYIKKAEKLYNDHSQEIIQDADAVSKPVLFAYKFIEVVNHNSPIGTNDILSVAQKINQLDSLKKLKKFNSREQLMHAIAFNMLGDLYIRKKTNQSAHDLQTAHQYLDKALQLLDRNLYDSHYFQIQFNKVKAYKLQKKHRVALQLINKLLSQLPSEDSRHSFFQAEKTTILIAMQEKEKALKTLRLCIDDIHHDTSPLQKDFKNFVPSNALNETGLLVEMADIITNAYPKDSTSLLLASHMYRMGLKQFENCYRDELFNKKLSEYYNKAIGGILKMKKLGFGFFDAKSKLILNTIENIENRLAWKEFYQNRTSDINIVSDSLLRNELKARTALALAREKKDTATIFKIENNLKKQHFLIREQNPNVATFAYDDFDIQTLQEKLSNEQAVIRYKKIDSLLYQFVITNTTIDFQEIENYSSLANQVTRYRKDILNRNENKQLAKQLYKILIPTNIRTYQNLTIIPDGILHLIPFEVLVTQKDTYLIQETTINYASHLVFVKNELVSEFNTDNELIVFTPKYPKNSESSEISRASNTRLIGAERESEMLASLFTGKHFQSINATKENFIAHAANAKILHLAMHATINNETPELSHLLFTENLKKHPLYIEELYGMRLHADLAVLSACNTATGKLDEAKGIVSVHRAFTFAGVPATVASIWEVPDKASQEIMVSFYKNLKRGANKSKALQEAKIRYLQNTDDANFLSPYYWAGFQLYGDSSPILSNNVAVATNHYYIILSIVMVFIIICIYAIKRKRNRQNVG